MPRSGAVTLSGLREPTLTLLRLSARQGRYTVAKPMKRCGDAKLTELLQSSPTAQRRAWRATTHADSFIRKSQTVFWKPALGLARTHSEEERSAWSRRHALY
jgi:hypothetical protein